ncbi:unnamed protein product, partial [marine sediment metagenome]
IHTLLELRGFKNNTNINLNSNVKIEHIGDMIHPRPLF